MGRGLSVKFDTREIRDRFNRYRSDLKTLLESEWPMIVQECLADVLSRAPDPGTEYAYLMGYEGGYGYGDNAKGKTSLGNEGHLQSLGFWTFSPISAHRTHDHRGSGFYFSSRGAHPEARIRFIRTPGLWLQELVMDPATYQSSFRGNKFKIGLGKVKALESLSRFSWVNYSGATDSAYEHTSKYGTWSFFEYGLSNLVQPHRWSTSMASGVLRGNGLGYKLKPSDYEHYWAMMKHYPKLRMYSGFDKAVFIAAVESRIRAVKF